MAEPIRACPRYVDCKPHVAHHWAASPADADAWCPGFCDTPDAPQHSDEWYDDAIGGWVRHPTQNDGLTQFECVVRQTASEATTLLLSKHADYGPKNIADAPGGPLNGLAVRLHDKVSRLVYLLATGSEPNHEALRDTMIDICCYGMIGVLVEQGDWPGVRGDGAA